MNRKNRMKVVLRRSAGRAFALAPLVFLAVAGAGCPSLFESSTQRATHVRQAVVGRDGAHTVSGNETVNRYAQLAGAADPVAGDTTITVTDVNGDFSAAVSQGDLLLIIQMAGATINTTSNDATYGSITALGSAGRYELIGVEGRTGNVITLACGLKNGYSRDGKTQVIRVPQYTTLTIPAGTSITASVWDGRTGGVVAVHAETTLDLAGTINAAAKGFRGGGTDNLSQNPPGTSAYFSGVPTAGAEKGEGIGGFQADLGATYFGRGAPANGGGGGDAHNAGGGGGANAAAGATWSGQGVMEKCAVGQDWRSAWQLDPGYIANTNACTNSQGGGRGGYSYSYSATPPSPLSVAPGDASWGGDDRREVGGLGGRPVPNDPTSRLFFGGGGGAGDGNNNAAGRGGRGGGLVFIIAGSVTGSGSIAADGEAGGNAVFTAGGGDGPGGGGGGGTVVIHATSLASTVSITVDGGDGGNQVGSTGPNEVEGPGGGGGGGYIAVSGGTPATLSSKGGQAGTTDRGSMSTFPVDGATAGNGGVTNGNASSFLYCATTDGPVTTIATKPPLFSNVATGSFTFTNTQTPVTYECKIDSGSFVPCNASFTTTALNDGSHTLSVQSTNLGGKTETPPVTYTWTIDTVAPVTTIATYPANPSPSPSGSFTFTNTETSVTYECKLDSAAWAPCNASDPTTASFSTPLLGDGTHTLTVRSTDQAGNVEQTPPSYTWTIEAGALDAGVDGGGPALDSGIDGAVVFLDAEAVDQAVDVGAGDDAVGNKDVAAPDLPSDAVIIINPDLPGPQPGVDGAVDQGIAIDSQVVDSNADSAGDAADARAGAEPGPDAVVAEPNRDAAVVVIEDAAVTKKDAPVANDDLKVLGSGFCTVAAPGAGSPAVLVLVGLAFVGLMFRRRRS